MADETKTEDTTVVEETTEGAPTVEEALSDAHDAQAEVETAVETEAADTTPAPLTTEQVEQRETDYSTKVKALEEREARYQRDQEAFSDYRDRVDGRERETDDKPQQPGTWLTYDAQTENETAIQGGFKHQDGKITDHDDRIARLEGALHTERVKNNEAEIAAAKEVLQERFPETVGNKDTWSKAEQLTIDLIKAAQSRGEDYSITELLTHNVQALAQPGSAERARADVHKTAGAAAKARVPAGGPAGARKDIGTIDEELERAAREAQME